MSLASWIVFDVYGTLLDIESAADQFDAEPALMPGLLAVWRAKQLEYSWTLQAMGMYRDFWALTGDALDYAITATGAADYARDGLLDAYLHLEPFVEVHDVMAALRASGVRLAVMSNGTVPMLGSALDAAGISPSLDEVISIDEVGIYKPDPRAYRHAVERLGGATSRIRFVSANAWDAAGARRAGLDATWINRRGQPPEYGLVGTAGRREDLRRLLTA